MLDWHKTYFGKVHIKEVLQVVKDEEWQKVRLDIKGKSLEYKHSELCNWLLRNKYSKAAKIQVTNYTTALSRGGLIMPGDYR